MVRLSGDATSGGKKFYLGPPAGTTATNYSLKMGNNVHLIIDQDVTLVRRFGGGTLTWATIINENSTSTPPTPPSGNSNIRISGGGAIATEGTGANFQGKHLGFASVKFLSIAGIRFPKVHNNWTTFFRDCEDVIISNVDIGNGSFADDLITEDGLHFAGGQRIVVDSCNIFCGDDCISLVHEGNATIATDARPFTDLRGFVASNCTLASVRANAVRVSIHQDYNEAKTISGVRISNIVAKAGFGVGGVTTSLGIEISDKKTGTAPLISDVVIEGLTLDASQNAIWGAYLSGVTQVRLVDVKILQPRFRVYINDCTFVDLIDCVVDTPRHEEHVCLGIGDTANCSDIRILGGEFSGGTHGVVLGGVFDMVNRTVTRFTISGATIRNNPNYGLYLVNATKGLIEGNQIFSNNTGIIESSPSDLNTIIGNRLDGNMTPLTIVGPNTQAIRNIATVAQPITDTGGFRQTIDGWTKENVSKSLTTPVELSRNNFTSPVAAGRFRAVRKGSITGIIVTCTEQCSGGTLTVEVYKNAGLAGANGSPTGLTATLTANNPTRSRAHSTQPRGVDTFNEGDELYIMVTTTNQWNPDEADIRCAIEIED